MKEKAPVDGGGRDSNKVSLQKAISGIPSRPSSKKCRPHDETTRLREWQDREWGWHDMRRKSANQMQSPCECNRTGRCWKPNCCVHWPEDRRS